MKILLTTMQYGPGYGQGTERYLDILRSHLPSDWHAQVLAGDPDERFPAAPLGTPRAFDPDVLSFPSQGWMSIGGSEVGKLRALLETVRPDLVHIANPAHIGLNLVAAARQLGIPVVLTTMDFWWVCPKQTLLRRPGGDVIETCRGRVDWRTCLCCVANENVGSFRSTLGQTPLLGRQLVPASYLETWRRRGLPREELQAWPRRQTAINALLNQAQAVIFPSQATADRIGPHVDGPRVHRIPYGLEPRWFMATSRRSKPSQRSAVRIGYAGALAPHKGVHTVIEALRVAGWHDVTFRIAGGGDDAYVDALHRAARDLPIEFCGRVPTDRMPHWLAELDLLIMPSLWPENLPIITLEAAALGVPLLCSDIEGVVELAPAAQRFRPGDARDLARQLKNWWAAETWARPPAISSAREMVAATRAVYEEALGCGR